MCLRGQHAVWTFCPFPTCGFGWLWLSWHPVGVQTLSGDTAELAVAASAFARLSAYDRDLVRPLASWLLAKERVELSGEEPRLQSLLG